MNSTLYRTDAILQTMKNQLNEVFKQNNDKSQVNSLEKSSRLASIKNIFDLMNFKNI